MPIDFRRIPTIPGAVISPAYSVLSTINLAPGASIDLDAIAIPTGVTGWLVGVDVSSSVAAKWEVKTRDGFLVITHDVFMTEQGGTFPWRPPTRDYVTQLGGIARNFRITVTNRDRFNAADMYVTVFWDES